MNRLIAGLELTACLVSCAFVIGFATALLVWLAA